MIEFETKTYLSRTLYSNEVTRYPNLTDEHTLDLLQRIKEGDEQAEDFLVLSYQRLIMSVVNKFGEVHGLDYMDLVQEGNDGLLKAIEAYDCKRKTKFKTYAYRAIYNTIIDAIRKKAKLIPVSDYVRKNHEDYPKVVYSLDQKHIDMNKPYVNNIKDESMRSNLERCLEDEKEEELYEILKHLNLKTKKMLMLYYGFGDEGTHTYEEIGDMFGISKAAVHQRMSRQLKRMKKQLIKCRI